MRFHGKDAIQVNWGNYYLIINLSLYTLGSKHNFDCSVRAQPEAREAQVMSSYINGRLLEVIRQLFLKVYS